MDANQTNHYTVCCRSPLRPAAAKTIHRSQVDTENRIVVNFETRRAVPHVH